MAVASMRKSMVSPPRRTGWVLVVFLKMGAKRAGFRMAVMQEIREIRDRNKKSPDMMVWAEAL